MKDNRRSFIRKSASLAALSMTGLSTSAFASTEPVTFRKKDSEVARDAGMQMCEAYFAGMQEQKMQLCKQMDVMGVVAGINTKMVGLGADAKPWDYNSIVAVRDAWDKQGLKLRVIEGPPALGDQTKLGLAGR